MHAWNAALWKIGFEANVLEKYTRLFLYIIYFIRFFELTAANL
jgi:hypothetical protein